MWSRSQLFHDFSSPALRVHVTDDLFADGDRGGLLGVWEGLELITEGDEGVGGQTLAPET